MAGYFRKLQGRVYDGAHVAKAAIKNGVFAGLDADGKVVALAAADANYTFRCVEKTELWGLPALVLDCVTVGGEAYFVEGDFSVVENAAYDEAQHEIAAGDFVKMKRPLEGEQVVLSVTSDIYSAAAVNTMYSLAQGGGITVVSADDNGGSSPEDPET